MTAFDTDVLSELLDGDPRSAALAAVIDPAERFVPVVVAGDLLRGRLNGVRQAEAGKGKISLETAYRLFAGSLTGVGGFQLLPYTATADAQFAQWRAAKIRVGSQDLRIAAICLAHGAKLVTRNARDYALVPGPNLDVWP